MPEFDHVYWDALYERNIDPWDFKTSDYEQAKYATTIAALSGQYFERGLELGCSIGVLTQKLAAHCQHLVAIDTSSLALDEAVRRVTSPHVEFRQAHLPNGNLGAEYDLIVASEILYYFTPLELRALAERLRALVRPGALFVSVHWTGRTNYPLTADDATALCFHIARIERFRVSVEKEFRLDVGRFS